MQFWVQLLQVGGNGCDQTLDSCIPKGHLKARLIGHHGYHWKHKLETGQF